MEDTTRDLRSKQRAAVGDAGTVFQGRGFICRVLWFQWVCHYNDWRENNHYPIKTSSTDFEKEQLQAGELNATTIPLDC